MLSPPVNKEMKYEKKRNEQAPSYASPKLSLTHLLTGVKCRATSVAKNQKKRFP